MGRRRVEIHDEEDREDERSRRSVLGFLPEEVAIASGIGGEVINRRLIDRPISEAIKRVDSGKPITSGEGRPITWLADHSRKELAAIQAAARDLNVKVPILKGRYPGSASITEVPNWLRRVADPKNKIPKVFEHISLGSTSLPEAYHELGHAKHVLGKKNLSRNLTALHLLTHNRSTGMNVLRLGLLGHMASPKSEDETSFRKFIRNRAPEIIAATTVPVLAEEARASAHAIRMGHRYGPGALATAKELLPSFASYLGGAGAVVMAAVMTKKLVGVMRDADEKRRSEKTAALRAPVSTAWGMARTPSRPRTTVTQTGPTPVAKEMRPTPPPSKTPFSRDMLASLYNPKRTFRLNSVG